MIKVLHSADWHLDAPLGQFSPEQRKSLREKQLALPGLIADVARREQCDLALLSGDLFDGAYTRQSVQAVYRALESMAIPVFVAPGNHDYYGVNSPWYRETWPENVYVFSSEKIRSYALPEWNCRVYGAAFTGRDCPGLLEGFQADCQENYALMVLHGDPTGGNSPYNPVTVAQVRDSGLDYLALGHIHTQGQFSAGAGVCAWPGCPMGHGWDETGIKGVYVVELDHQAQVRFVPLDVPRFYDLSVDVSRGLERSLEGVLPGGGSQDYFRIHLTGEADAQLLSSSRWAPWPNVTWVDETVAPIELWDGVGSDTLEGVYFGLLREKWESGDPEAREDAKQAAKLSRRILMGQEVELP